MIYSSVSPQIDKLAVMFEGVLEGVCIAITLNAPHGFDTPEPLLSILTACTLPLLTNKLEAMFCGRFIQTKP